VQVESIKSSPLKASPNGLEPTTPEARAAIEALITDSYDWFKGLVRDRRGLDEAALAKVVDGRVYTGRQALELKLIDGLGDELAAVDWLAKEKGIDPKTPVRDYRLNPRFSDLPFLHTGAVWLLDAVGLSGLAEHFKDWGAVQAVERLNLDGLVALWHPSTTN
jgi:protease-4